MSRSQSVTKRWPILALGMISSIGTSAQAHAAAAFPTGIAFTEALQFSLNPLATGLNYTDPCCDSVTVTNSAPASLATSTYTKSWTWGSVTGFASADLATGQLRVRAAVSDLDGTSHPSVSTNAIFGGSFNTRTTNGTPFASSAASQAAFTIGLNGTLTSSSPLASTNGVDVFIILSILQPGTLDPSKQLINGPSSIQYFFWNIGNPGTKIYYTDLQGNIQVLVPTAEYTSIPSTLSAAFVLGGNFDWVLAVGAGGQLGTAVSSYDLDLSHTLTLSYAGPNGSVTSAASGQFANFDPTLAPASVPEPASLVLLGCAVIVTVAARRRPGSNAT